MKVPKIYIENHLEAISEEKLAEMLENLPEWRREQALRIKHQQGQKECAVAYALLCRGLAKEYGIFVQPSFAYEENGKPTLKEFPQIHFNISHCKKGVVCALSDDPVGIDIECISRYKEQLVNYTMNAEEQAEILAAEKPAIAFTRLWTMKEAKAKLTGEGISTNVRNLLHSSNIIYNTRVHEDEGYIITTATYK